jgi:hypothetical protein
MIATNLDEVLSQRTIFYCRERLRNRIFDCVIKAMADRVASGAATRAMIARRLGKDPGQVSRWFSGPSNWTIDTISDLMLALDAELILEPSLYEDLVAPNYRHPLAQVVESASVSHFKVQAHDGPIRKEVTGSGTGKTIIRMTT